MAVDPRALDALGDACADRVGERPVPRRLVAHPLETSLEGRGHRRDTRDVLHAGAAPPLSVVPARVRGDRNAPANVERPDPRRSPELVPRDRKQVDLEGHRVHRQVADRLAGIRVEQHARLTAQPSALCDRLDRSHLVVRVVHGREERARAADLRGERVEVDRAVAVHPDEHGLEPVGLERMEHAAHRGVFDRRRDDPGAELADRPDAAPDRERHRLGAPAREHDLVGLGSERACDRRAGVVEQSFRRQSVPVHAQRVGELVQRSEQRDPRALVQRGRGRVIKVGARRHHGKRAHDTGAPPKGCVRVWPAPGPSGTPWRTGPPR